MNQSAVKFGQQLIELERLLNETFANRAVTKETLREQLSQIENVRKELRFVHQVTHLVTPTILTPHQIKMYNQLRGYAKGSPCDNVPEGHDAKMWKEHNNCN
jgi:enterochelin esterase-like enzyme